MKKMKILFIALPLFFAYLNGFAQNYNWEYVDIGYFSYNIYDIKIAKNGDVFVSVFPLCIKSNENSVVDLPGIIFRGANGGNDWSAVMSADPNYTPPDCDHINAMDLNSSDDIFVIHSDFKIENSKDLGNTWEIVSEGFYNLLLLTKDDNILIEKYEQGIFISTDNGSTWIETLADGEFLGYSRFYMTPNGNIFVATKHTGLLYRSTDGGFTWENVNIEITQGDFCISAMSDGTIYLGRYVTPNSGDPPLLKSTDDGETWESATDFFVYSVEPIFCTKEDGLLAYYNLEGKLYYSEDKGETWKPVLDINTYQTGYVNTFSQDEEGNIYLGAEYGLFRINESLLPVELISFTARANGNDVSLNWTTATETNNKGFEIQRTINNEQLTIEDWESVGFVEGNGTTTEARSYSFDDKNLENGKYFYRLKQIDYDGTFEYGKTVEVEINPIYKFRLEQNYPNPYSKSSDGSPATAIKFSIPNSGNVVTLKVYDGLGSEVATLVNKKLSAGEYEVKFDGSGLPSGVYYYRLKAGNFAESKKMIILK